MSPPGPPQVMPLEMGAKSAADPAYDDSYLFELTSMVLALSGGKAGLSFLARHAQLLNR